MGSSNRCSALRWGIFRSPSQGQVRTSADGAVIVRIPKAYQWLIVPVQNSPQTALEWQAFRLSGSSALEVRAGKKLRNDELLVLALAGTVLRGQMDKVPLWRGNRVEIVAGIPYMSKIQTIYINNFLCTLSTNVIY